MKLFSIIWPLVLPLLLGSCDPVSTGSCEPVSMGARTYPPAQNWRLVSVSEAKSRVSVPDFVNVIGYVKLKVECPANEPCSQPDAIYLSERMYSGDIDWDSSLRVESRPAEFRVGDQYLFSIRIGEDSHLRLEGYNWIAGCN